MKLDHINISAPMELLESVKEFYCEVLGLQDGFRPEFPKGGFWLYAEDRPIVHLYESDAHFRNQKQGYLDHVAFRARGLSVIVNRLDLLGIDYRSSHIPEIPMTQLFMKDPAGTGVEINFPDEP